MFAGTKGAETVKYIRASLLCAVVLGLAASASGFSRTRDAHPYVQSGPDGVFYARCVPSADGKGPGSTKIFRVRADKDELVDSYDWYARDGVVLGWSPLAGKVAVMRLQRGERDPGKPATGQAEFSFYLGGKLLKSYTTQELLEMGAEASVLPAGGRGAVYRVLGCEQVPGANQYHFVIETKEGRKLSFDVVTAKPAAPPGVICG
jgi:hypothetical protein